MGLFNKKSDTIDLTRLQKRGILSRVGENSKEEIVDLSSSSANSGNSGVGDFGFLNNFAASSAESESSGSYVDTLRKQRKSAGEMSDLKVKIENIEYKLERYIEKLDAIEDKLRALKS